MGAAAVSGPRRRVREDRRVTLLPGPAPDATAVTVWSLEMTSATQLRPGRRPEPEPVLLAARRPAPELSRFFYALVGGPWHWVDRRDWSAAQWTEWVDRPEHRLVTCWADGVPAGYFELEQQDRDVELVYFGLVPGFLGVGLGGWLLTEALRAAWTFPGAERVWLHTCSLDGPAALANYRARGLTVFAETTEWRRVPADRAAGA